jgi:HEAT repeat protein
MRRLAACMLLAAAILPPLSAADDSDAKERTRQALLYGIDSQVIEAVQAIGKADERGFSKELALILADQRSTDLRKAILELFRGQKERAGEDAANDIVAGWQEARPALVAAAVKYLAAIESQGLAARLAPLVDASDNDVAAAAIQALGAAGDASSADLLVAKLKSLDYPDGRKNDLILALGALKNAAAVDALIAIAKSTDENKIRRMYAADSLGKIGDSKALAVLRDMFAENDALIRQYAASALSHFGLDDVFPSLIQGLRDDNAKVREQSAKTLARKLGGAQAEEAIPVLAYKAENDPAMTVRIASIQALGAIGGDKAYAVLLRLFGASSSPLDCRAEALTAMAAGDLGKCIDAIRAVVDAEWSSYDQRVLVSVARALSTVKSAGLKELFTRFLDAKDPSVRSYAVRGIALNGFTDLKERVKRMSEQDANPGARREATKALEKM